MFQALERSPLLEHMLQDGKLVAPCSDKSVALRAYFVMKSSAAADKSDVKQFVERLFKEAGSEADEKVPKLRK